jgi:hypothetical protein
MRRDYPRLLESLCCVHLRHPLFGTLAILGRERVLARFEAAERMLERLMA